jgi:hypothetical protein
MNLKEVIYEDVDWIQLGPVMHSFEYCNKSFGARKC